MENTSIQYLTKPKIKGDALPYVNANKEIYVNLFKIIIKKPLTLYQYPYSVSPEIETGDLRIRSKLFKYCSMGEKKDKKKPKDVYGECFISGDSLYGMKEVKESKTFKCKLYLDGETEYTITFQPKAEKRTINQNDLEKDNLTKQFIEILIRDILHGNPNLDFYKGLFVLKDQKKVISSKKGGSVNFYPGYTTSFMETEGGNYLNVTLKNKILSTETILEFLDNNQFKNKKNHDKIRDSLIGRSFKVKYAKKNYVIDDILFDRNPDNTDLNYDNKTIKLTEYYNLKYKIKIKELTQPLLVVKRKDAEGNDINLYFIPELCYLAGLDDEFLKDRDFMKKLADYTKLTPQDRINKTNEFLKLLVETKKEDDKKLSAKEKSDLYGIEVKALDKSHRAYYMKETVLIGGDKKAIKTNKPFDVLSKKDMTEWICLYRKSNYDDAGYLSESLKKASHGYGLVVSDPEWVEMDDRASAQEWIDSVEDYMSNGKYKFVVFLLDRNDYIYRHLKVHSLCHNGYVSQVVKAHSLQKNALSVCSKILLQINSKLSGVSYMPKFDDEVKKRKLMIIGVDSSHIKGKRTGVAMVATINTSFTNFYNKESIIEEKTKEKLQFCISGFIIDAVAKYKELNKKPPSGIIIYRQGVSLQQKDYLLNEVNNIKKVCADNKLLFYYILVNTKTTYKFFEKNNNKYSNPGEGLLVLDGVTNRNFFEFYIQPQLVTGGSATPSCFHVAYGDLDFPEMIPKLTFDLCHLYSNWQGTVRVPHVLKSAEKLSKMTAKYTLGELHQNLKVGQAYL